MNNDLIQLIMTRTSIRAFQDKPVSDETVEVLLKAAMSNHMQKKQNQTLI